MVKNSSDKRYKDRNEQMSRGPECGLCTYQEALLLGDDTLSLFTLPLPPSLPVTGAMTVTQGISK